MHSSQLHYLPLTPAFFSILVIAFLVLVALIQVGALHYAYTRLGVSAGAVLWLLLTASQSPLSRVSCQGC